LAKELWNSSVLKYNGLEFTVRKNDHLPPHVHVEANGLIGLYVIEKNESKTPHSPKIKHLIRQIINIYKTQLLKKWKAQNPPEEKAHKQSRKRKKRDALYIPFDYTFPYIGVYVMPISNENHDIGVYPPMRKWRKFDDINTVAVEFMDGTIRLYPEKINEILHPHIGYGDYQENCGEMFKTLRVAYIDSEVIYCLNGKKIRKKYKKVLRYDNNDYIHLGYVYHYGISFDGFNSIDELTEQDCIQIAAAEGLDLLSPPSYGPNGCTKEDYEACKHGGEAFF